MVTITVACFWRDAAGARPLMTIYPNGRVVVRGYGEAGSADDRLGRVRDLAPLAGAPVVQYGYLGLGSCVMVDYPQPGLRLDYAGPGSADAKYPGLDRFNRVVQHRWQYYGATPGLRDGYDYGYDAGSNRRFRANLTAQALDKPFDELYRHDRLNRLTHFQRGTLNAGRTAITGTPVGQQAWRLDPTGNWERFQKDQMGLPVLDQVRAANPSNEITAITSWRLPEYDDAGNMTVLPEPHDPTKPYHATWDAWNRLVKLVGENNCGCADQPAAAYQYDALHRRIVTVEFESGTPQDPRHFYHSPDWQVIEERVGAATLPERQYIWGLRYIDDLVLRDRDADANGTLEERLYALQDANWNVTSLANPSGTILERYAYDAYGTPEFLAPDYTPRTEPSYAWNRLFTGQTHDATSGLYHYRHRYYHTELGVWLTRDPIGVSGVVLQMNLYQYAGGSPTHFVDPQGLAIYVEPVFKRVKLPPQISPTITTTDKSNNYHHR